MTAGSQKPYRQQFAAGPHRRHWLGWGGLGLLCLGLISIGCQSPDEIAEKPKDTIEDAYQPLTEPDKLSNQSDLREFFDENRDYRHLLVSRLREKSRLLENHISEWISGNESDPLFAGVSLRSTGLDRKQFQTTFKNDRIQVMRWRYSDQVPSFGGPHALKNAILNGLQPWIGAKEFQVDLLPTQVTENGQEVSSRIVAEIFGRTGDDLGRQAIAIWDTTWELDEFKEGVSLTEFSIRAQEEIVNRVNGGRLLQDCTGSVLRRCENATSQLAINLDDWGRYIPGIDITGNSGVAVGDINQDGLDDIYVCQPHGLPNFLLLQNPDGSVDDRASEKGLDVLDDSHGALMVDLDNDGDQDLVIATDQSLLFFSQADDSNFQLANQLPIGRDTHSLSATDFDRDGDLDLYLCKYWGAKSENLILPAVDTIPEATNGGRNILLRNDEGWQFTDVTEPSGLSENNHSYTRAAAWVDFDLDGDQDLFVANEFGADRLFENQEGWFTEQTSVLGHTLPGNTRSVASGDFNQDGRFDFFVATSASHTVFNTLLQIPSSRESVAANMMTAPSRVLYSTNGDQFDNYAFPSLLFTPRSAFGSAAADINNDGYDDILVANGFLSRNPSAEVDAMLVRKTFSRIFDIENATEEQKQESIRKMFTMALRQSEERIQKGDSMSGFERNRCYLSLGQRGFANFSEAAGFDHLDDTRSIATTDWDGDGDVDVITTNRTSPQFRILCNQSDDSNNYLMVDLVGTQSNRDAIGARVELHVNGLAKPLIRSLSAGSGFLSQSSKRLVFGLGKFNDIRKAAVVWPNGNQQSFYNIRVNSHYRLIEGNEAANVVPPRSPELLAIQPAPAPVKDNAPLSLRSVFYPPMDLPKLQFQGQPGRWFGLEFSREKPLLLAFWEQNGRGQLLLERIKSGHEQLTNAGIEVLAVYDEAHPSDAQTFHAAESLIIQTRFPFHWGTISPSSLQKLEIMLGKAYDHQDLDLLPLAFLLDRNGRVHASYSPRQLKVETVVKDLALLKADERERQRYFGNGRWISQNRRPVYDREIRRMRQHGFELDALRLAECSAPGQAMELTHVARAHHSQGNLAQAESHYQQAIELDPGCTSAYVGYAQFLLDRSQAEETTDKRRDLLEAARENFATASKLDPADSAAVLGLSEVAIAQQKTGQALEAMKDYLRLEPDRYDVHAAIGRLYFFKRDFIKSADHLLTAYENQPTLPNVAGDLGYLYLNSGQYSEAVKFLRLANRVQPSNPSFQRFLGLAEFFDGNFQQALTVNAQVVQTQPAERQPKMILAWVLATAPDDALRDADRALTYIKPLVDVLGNQSPTVLEIAAAAHAENDDFATAIEFQQRALKLIDAGEGNLTTPQAEGARHRLDQYLQSIPSRTTRTETTPIAKPSLEKKVSGSGTF